MNESPVRRMANVNGDITPLEDARISVLDRGFLYGDSVYEVFRTYSGVPLFCHEHFDRMENSARLVHMKISQPRDEWLAVTRVRRNPVEALSPDIKSGNYLNNILGVAEAVELAADDCLMLNPAGVLTEASNSNV